MQNLQIKLLDNSYSKSIVDLILPIQQEEFHVPITLEQQKDLLNIEDFYIHSGGAFWGAFYDGELIGTIAFLNMQHQSAAIRKMFVKQAYRGKEFAVAHQLLSVLKTYCISNGIFNLYLSTVNILKAAHRFYEKNGFQKVDKDQFPSYFPFMVPDDTYYQLLNIQNDQ